MSWCPRPLRLQTRATSVARRALCSGRLVWRGGDGSVVEPGRGLSHRYRWSGNPGGHRNGGDSSRSARDARPRAPAQHPSCGHCRARFSYARSSGDRAADWRRSTSRAEARASHALRDHGFRHHGFRHHGFRDAFRSHAFRPHTLRQDAFRPHALRDHALRKHAPRPPSRVAPGEGSSATPDPPRRASRQLARRPRDPRSGCLGSGTLSRVIFLRTARPLPGLACGSG